jgi:hypothetical protein
VNASSRTSADRQLPQPSGDGVDRQTLTPERDLPRVLHRHSEANRKSTQTGKPPTEEGEHQQPISAHPPLQPHCRYRSRPRAAAAQFF